MGTTTNYIIGFNSGAGYWTSPVTANAYVEVWGAGGSSASTTDGGGGGGAYSAGYISITSGTTYSINIGGGGGSGNPGGATWFNSSGTLNANGGSGTSTATGAAGGTAGSTGSVNYAGGAGATYSSGAGGGGAGGPNGAGLAGTSTTGGKGSNGSGGAGGTTSSYAGSRPSNDGFDTSFSYFSGAKCPAGGGVLVPAGGGGGGGGATTTYQNGGFPGGGGGQNGFGQNGMIRITWITSGSTSDQIIWTYVNNSTSSITGQGFVFPSYAGSGVTVECFGGGGGGFTGGHGGGAGGSYSNSVVSTLTVGTYYSFQVGGGGAASGAGAATWYDTSSTYAANGGAAGATSAGGAGSTTGSVGTTLKAGGSGAGTSSNYGGGGGAGGSAGVGNAGTASSTGGAGGSGDAGSGGSAGSAGGGAGGNNTLGGGGGGGKGSTGTGGAGGYPGGGGGAGGTTGGIGGAGMLQFTWTPSTTLFSATGSSVVSVHGTVSTTVPVALVATIVALSQSKIGNGSYNLKTAARGFSGFAAKFGPMSGKTSLQGKELSISGIRASQSPFAFMKVATSSIASGNSLPHGKASIYSTTLSTSRWQGAVSGKTTLNAYSLSITNVHDTFGAKAYMAGRFASSSFWVDDIKVKMPFMANALSSSRAQSTAAGKGSLFSTVISRLSSTISGKFSMPMPSTQSRSSSSGHGIVVPAIFLRVLGQSISSLNLRAYTGKTSLSGKGSSTGNSKSSVRAVMAFYASGASVTWSNPSFGPIRMPLPSAQARSAGTGRFGPMSGRAAILGRVGTSPGGRGAPLVTGSLVALAVAMSAISAFLHRTQPLFSLLLSRSGGQASPMTGTTALQGTVKAKARARGVPYFPFWIAASKVFSKTTGMFSNGFFFYALHGTSKLLGNSRLSPPVGTLKVAARVFSSAFGVSTALIRQPITAFAKTTSAGFGRFYWLITGKSFGKNSGSGATVAKQFMGANTLTLTVTKSNAKFQGNLTTSSTIQAKAAGSARYTWLGAAIARAFGLLRGVNGGKASIVGKVSGSSALKVSGNFFLPLTAKGTSSSHSSSGLLPLWLAKAKTSFSYMTRGIYGMAAHVSAKVNLKLSGYGIETGKTSIISKSLFVSTSSTLLRTIRFVTGTSSFRASSQTPPWTNYIMLRAEALFSAYGSNLPFMYVVDPEYIQEAATWQEPRNFVVYDGVFNYKTVVDQRSYTISPKDPVETVIVTFDFSGVLAPGEVIETSLSVTCVAFYGTDGASAAMVSGVAMVEGSKLLQAFQGGVDGNLYKIKATVVTNAGTILTSTAILPVVSQ